MHKEEKGEDRYQDVWKEGKTSARRSFKSSLCKIEQPSGGTGYSLLGKRGVYCIYTAKEGPSAFSRTLMETVAWCCGKERYIDSKKMKLRKKSIVLSESESESESESLSLSRFLSLSLSLSLSRVRRRVSKVPEARECAQRGKSRPLAFQQFYCLYHPRPHLCVQTYTCVSVHTRADLDTSTKKLVQGLLTRTSPQYLQYLLPEWSVWPAPAPHLLHPPVVCHVHDYKVNK